MSMRLKPANDIPDSITRSKESFLTSDLRAAPASVPSTSMVPILTVWMCDLRNRTASSSARSPPVLVGEKAPSSTPTILRSRGSVLLERFWYVSK